MFVDDKTVRRNNLDKLDTKTIAPTNFDIDLSEPRKMFSDFLKNQIGVPVEVDGTKTYAMITDLDRIYTNLQQNAKYTQFLYGTKIERGSFILFENGVKAFMYSMPDEDVISVSGQVVMCNAEPIVYQFHNNYDEDVNSPTYGERTHGELVKHGTADGFMEIAQIVRKEKDYGLFQETELLFTTSSSYYEFENEDIFYYKNKFYEVTSIDDITDGIITVQLRNAKIDYERFIFTL